MRGQVTPTKVLRGHYGSMTYVAFPSCDQIISASEDRTIRRFGASGERSEILREGAIRAVAASPNRRWVAFGGQDGKVRLFDVETPGTIARSVGKHEQVIQSLAFSPDSAQLASGARDGSMYLWSAPSLELIAGPFAGHRDNVWCICYSPDGKKIATCDRESVQIWETDTRIGLSIVEPAWSVAWSSDGDILFAGCIDGTIKRCDPTTGRSCIACKHHTDVVSSITVSHNTKFIVTASWDRTVRFFEAVTFQPVGPALKHDAPVHSISISPDDSFLVTGARDPHVRTWNLRTIAPALFRPIPLEPVRAPTTKGAPIRWPSYTRSPTSARSPNDLHQSDKSPRPGSEESLENKSIKSEKPKKPLINVLKIPRTPTRKQKKRDTVLDELRTPTSSNTASSHTDSASFHTDKISLRSASSCQLVEGTTVSPVTCIQPPSPTPIRVSDSENWSFIREIRSDPTHDLSGNIVPEGSLPITGGSHGDVYRGTLHVNGQAMTVAIKAIKQYLIEENEQSKKRRLRREIQLWLKLEHQNILPLLGTTRGYGSFPAMVCPWAENGKLTSYLEANNNDLTAQQRWCIINDVALGLQYLHSQSIVHGDISGANILVYASGRACISDFGLSIVEVNLEDSSVALTYQVKGTLCWTAPELLAMCDTEGGTEGGHETEGVQRIFPTTHSDIYSFGGIMLQVLSGRRPYHNLSHDRLVIVAISKGEHPKRPSSTSVVSDVQWDFMMACWSFEAMDRPSDPAMVTFVHEQLLGAVSGLNEPSLRRMRRDTIGEGC